MEPKTIFRRIYEFVTCFLLGHDPKPFNGPFQDCARCDKTLVTDWNR